MLEFINIALQLTAQVYGMGELYCGDYNQKPQPCGYGAVMASGAIFEPHLPIAAVPMPRNRILRPTWICLQGSKGQDVWIRLADKKHERYIGNIGFDLSPKAVELVTGKPATRHWSGKVQECES